MTNLKAIIYSLVMLLTFIGELCFLILGLGNGDYILFAGLGACYLVQAAVGGIMFYEAVFKKSSESTYTTMAFGMLIPFGQTMSSYFLYRVCKGE